MRATEVYGVEQVSKWNCVQHQFRIHWFTDIWMLL